jgi:hypothetical protein
VQWLVHIADEVDDELQGFLSPFPWLRLIRRDLRLVLQCVDDVVPVATVGLVN